MSKQCHQGLHREGPGVNIIGIDPGPTQSAAVVMCTALAMPIVDMVQEPNEKFLAIMREYREKLAPDIVAIEDVTYYGLSVGRDVFDTLKIIGRLQEMFDGKHRLVSYPDIAVHFCGQRGGVKTSNINQVLISRRGPKGTKKAPGILYGIREHVWSALAVAQYWIENNKPKEAL